MKRSGFILGEHLIGLTIILIGITFFVTTTQLLVAQKKRMEEQVIATRIACEKVNSGCYLADREYHVIQSSTAVVVMHQGREVLRICR